MSFRERREVKDGKDMGQNWPVRRLKSAKNYPQSTKRISTNNTHVKYPKS